MKVELTVPYIDKLKFVTRKEITDESKRNRKPRRGLVLLANPTSDHTWLYQRMVDGTRIKKVLGTYPDLSLAEARNLVDVINEADIGPVATLDKMFAPKIPEADAGTLTIQRLINKYLDENCDGNRTVLQQRRVLEKEMRHYLSLPAGDLTTEHVLDIVQACLDRKAPRSAQEILKQIQSMYNWALGQKRANKRLVAKSDVNRASVRKKIPSITTNPTEGIEMPSYKVKSFHLEGKALESFLSKLWASDIREDIKLVLTIQMQTFCRVGEVAGMQWDELDLRKRKWTIPAARYKNFRDHTVCLSDQTVALLKELKMNKQSDTNVFRQPVNDKPLNTGDVGAAINKNRKSLKVDPRFASHALRHSASTWLAAQHCPLEVRERLLGHAVDDPTNMSQRYQHHQFFKEREDWTQRWNDFLEAGI